MKKFLTIFIALLIIAPLFSLGVNVKTIFAAAPTVSRNLGEDCGWLCVSGEGDWIGSYCNTGTTCLIAGVCGGSTNWTDKCATGLSCSNSTKKCVASGSGSSASPATLDLWGGHSADGAVTEETLRGNTGLGNSDPREIAARVINIILGFLGIIAVVLILAGGFIWMTAAGNDDKTATAKKIMSAGVVGLVIVLAAFGIAKFVINAMVDATK